MQPNRPKANNCKHQWRALSPASNTVHVCNRCGDMANEDEIRAMRVLADQLWGYNATG